MVTRDTVHQVHMNNALPKTANAGTSRFRIIKENVRNGGTAGPSQTYAPATASLTAQQQKYSAPKHAVPLSAAGSTNWKNAGSRAIQILKDSKSRKNEQKANGQAAALPMMSRLGLTESAFGSKNGLNSSGKRPNGTPPNRDPRNLGRPSSNISNPASSIYSPQPVVTSGLLFATNVVSSSRTRRSAASPAGSQKSSALLAALRSNQQKERNEARRPATSSRAMTVSKPGGGFTTVPKEHSRRTTGYPCSPGPRTFREAAATGIGTGASSSATRGHHLSRTSDPTCSKPAPAQTPLPRCSSATTFGNKVARGSKVAGGAQAHLGRVRQAAGSANLTQASSIPQGRPCKGGGGALEQYLKKHQHHHHQQQQQRVEEPLLFMGSGRLMIMDLESVPNSLDDDKIILDLPDP